MSVKLDARETIRAGVATVQDGKDELANRLGGAVAAAGAPRGYLASYLQQLQANPLRTKMITSGTLSGAQEFLATWIAKDRNKNGHYFTSRVPKMAAYGALISAPLGHFLIGLLQRLFAGRTSVKAKVLQILVSNLIVAPIQNTIYLASMAFIAGATRGHQISASVRTGFWPVMRLTWISSPLALAFAQAFLPQETWVPFFNIVAFVIGTYINTYAKKKRLAALKRKAAAERDGRYEEKRY